MPTYEFRCLDCRKKVELFMTYEEYGKAEPRCPHCQGKNLQRKIGRIRVARSEESRLESMADPARLAALEDDPRALGGMMRQMGDQVGEEMGPEFNEVVSRLESGQSPEEIDSAMPDLGGGGGSDGDDF
ncbi:MAG: zinc ribbon domain-containing protein [Chloroflexi bacterium]|nr:zinc ribbon domain-containing protein [Chloroflexota bacterium]